VPTLEEMLASANGWFFLKEFFFSNTKFAPPGRTELELADGIVLFEDVLIVFQAKAREQPTSDPASEEKWFEKRVSRDAVKQVNDTLAYLRDHDIVLRNDRGDEVALPRGLKGLRIVSLVLYAPGSALPPHLRLRKGRLSTTAGMFVHFLPADGYSRVLSTLFTLPEILDYFGHRCTWALKLGPDADRLYEKALVGHYLAGSDEVPANADARWVDTLVDDTDAFQIVRILRCQFAGSWGQPFAGTWGQGGERNDFTESAASLVRCPSPSRTCSGRRCFAGGWGQCQRDRARARGCARVFMAGDAGGGLAASSVGLSLGR
jgi:hypothetical protein